MCAQGFFPYNMRFASQIGFSHINEKQINTIVIIWLLLLLLTENEFIQV